MRQFEISIGASNGVIGNAIKKNTDIQSKWISIIIEKYKDINPIWLLTGNEDMISYNKENQPKIKEPPPCPPPPVTNCENCEAKDATIQAQKTTIKTLERLTKSLEEHIEHLKEKSPAEAGQQKKQESNLVSSDEEQKRKAVIHK
jgi:hypothetical protein